MTLPAAPPTDPQEASSVIEAQTAAEGSGAFEFTWQACCNNSLAGNGHLASDGSVTSLAQLSNPDAFPGAPGVPPEDLAAPVAVYVGPDETQVDMGNGWKSFPAAEVEAASAEDLPRWVAMRAGTVHHGVSPAHAAALVAATDQPAVSTDGGLTTYSGTATLEQLAGDEFVGELYSVPTDPGIQLTVSYEITVDDT